MTRQEDIGPDVESSYVGEPADQTDRMMDVEGPSGRTETDSDLSLAETDPLDNLAEIDPDLGLIETDSLNGPAETEPEDSEVEAGPVDRQADEPVEIQPHRVVEAILFTSDSPMPPAKIAKVLGVGTARDIREHVASLNEQYTEWGLSFRIEDVAGGYRMLTLPAYNAWLTKLLRARQETKLSQAAMETLAIVAYKQPCTRADIESIRGVAAGDMLNRLREMNLVKIVGRAEDLGRPLLYGTTRHFLEVFGLPSLEDLPRVEALASGKAALGTPRPHSSTTADEQPDAENRVTKEAEAPGEDHPDASEGEHRPHAAAAAGEPEDASANVVDHGVTDHGVTDQGVTDQGGNGAEVAGPAMPDPAGDPTGEAGAAPADAGEPADVVPADDKAGPDAVPASGFEA
ncbi:MAG: SMC-Scp complex subunit ScpB [Phycisphaerae bacterium]|nr:SMC-Scp complex subunit ScpB [Phycisphaerae bacterium]